MADHTLALVRALACALIYAVLFVGFVLVFLPGELLQWAGVSRPASSGPPQVVGAGLVILGGALVVWCVGTLALVGRGTPAPFDPPRRLVVRGPYRFVRNPMYWGAGLALGGAALVYQSVVLAGYALLFIGAAHLLVRLYEEPTLRRSYGAEYDVYCRTVRRWWPIRPGGREDQGPTSG